MDTSILIMGLVISALFIIPFYFAFRHGRKGSAALTKLFYEEAQRHDCAVSKVGIVSGKGFILDEKAGILLWCESVDMRIVESRLVALGDAVECRVLVNNQLWSGKVNNNQQISNVKIRFTFTRGEHMRDSVTVFDIQSDDPMAALDAIVFASKWSDYMKPHLNKL